MDRIICDLCYFDSPQSFLKLLEDNRPSNIQQMTLMEFHLCSILNLYSHKDYVQICRTFLDLSRPLIQIFALLNSRLNVYLFLEAIRRDKLKCRVKSESGSRTGNNETLHEICRLVQIMKPFNISIDRGLTICGHVFSCGKYEPDHFAAILLGLYQVPVVVMRELIKTCNDHSFLINAIDVMKTKSIAPLLIRDYQQLLNEGQIIRPICIRPASAPARLETPLTDADESSPSSISPMSKLIQDELQKCFDELDAEEGERPPKKIHRDVPLDVPSPDVSTCPTITSMLHTAMPNVF